MDITVKKETLHYASLPQGRMAQRKTYWFCKHQMGLRLIVDTIVDDKYKYVDEHFRLIQGGAIAYDGRRIDFREYDYADAKRFYETLHLQKQKHIDWPYRPSF